MAPQSPHAHLADLLIEARRQGRQLVDLAPALIPATAADGYRVNDRVTEGLGWAPLGWKIAGTNPAMQRRLRTTEPISRAQLCAVRDIVAGSLPTWRAARRHHRVRVHVSHA